MTALQRAYDRLTEESTADPLHIAKARGLMAGYHVRWRDDGYTATAVEVTLTAPIPNLETQRNARTLSQAGKLDVLAKKDGKRVLIDHKTTSENITEPDGPFWRQLAVDSQVSHYMLLAWLNGQQCDDAIWDAIRKPGIRPKKLTKVPRGVAFAERHYMGRDLSTDTLDALQVDDRETLEMYEARLARDCIDDPDKYFQRRSVLRIGAEIIDYADELWMHSKDILHERKRKLPTRNPGACMMYGSPCQYLGVCSGHDTIESDKWRLKENTHNELPELNYVNGGRNTLTHSRIRCFQTCRRKHFYQYEMGVESEDRSDALLFGSLMHVALEAWWSFYLDEI